MVKFHLIIPTYFYADGLKSILDSIDFKENIFVYIFDNTSNRKVFNTFLNFKIKDPLLKNFFFFKNKPQTSAVINWNRGIKFLKHKCIKQDNIKNYYILLHQDEFFSKNFFKKMKSIIIKNKYPDVISCSTFVFYRNYLLNKLHTTSLQRKFFFKFLFFYILKRNFIGPTSSLVFKFKKKISSYNENLKWFVDVEYYLKNLNNKNVFFTDEVFVLSDQTNKFSLTFKYKNKINFIKRNELLLLNKNISILSRIFYEIFDYPIWILLRFYNKIKLCLNYKIYKF